MDFLSAVPNEILLEIFEFCKVQPLTLVCKRFNDIISSSSKLMRKMSLVIADKPEFSKMLMKSERSHQSVSFKFNYRINEDCLQVFEKFDEIKSLEMTRCIVSAKVFKQMLNLLPQLEKLSIYSSHLKDRSYLQYLDPPQLTKLKSLNFRNSDAAFLLLLKNSAIETMFAALPLTNLQDDFANFLRSQTRVKNIEYLNTLGVDETLMTVITQELHNLKRIHIEASGLNTSITRNSELTNSSARHLSFSGTPTESAADFNRIVNIFKALKTLEIEMNYLLEPEVIRQLQQQKPNLEALHITHCSGNYFGNLELRHLKELRLTDGSFAPDDWLSFASRNPSIEILVVKDESMTNEVFRIICLEFRQLKHFEVNFDPQRLTPEILDFVFDRAFPSNIRVLKVLQRSRSEASFFTLTDQHKKELYANQGFQCIFH